MSPTPVDSARLRLLTAEEVADLLQVRPRTVYQLVREGLPHIRMGRLLRFRLADLERWQESRATAVPMPARTQPAPALLTRDWSRRPTRK